MQNFRERIRLFYSQPRNVYLSLIAIALLLIGLSIIVVVAFPNLNNPNSKKVDLTKNEQNQILTDILKNNSNSVIKKPANNSAINPPIHTPTSDTLQPTPTTDPNLPDPLIVPDITQYNYRVTQTKYNAGPAASLCKLSYGSDGPGGYGLNENSTTKSYEFFDRTNSYYKTIYNDADNDLSNYYLTHYSNVVDTSNVYKGGSFAVKFNYKPYENFSNERDYDTVSYPGNSLPIQKSLENYYGSDVEIYDVVTIAGKIYFKIQYSYNVLCNVDNPYLYVPGVEPAKPETLITQLLVDSKSFEIIKTEMYLNNLGAENLISSTEITTTRQKVNFSTVSSNFNFEYSVPVRVIDYTQYNISYNPSDIAARVNAYLATIDLDMPFPNTDSGYALANLYAQDSQIKIPGADYYSERGFYPAGAKGDKIFAQINEASSYITPLVDSTFTLGQNNYYNTMYIDIYSDSVTQAQLISNINKYPSSSSSTSATTIVFGGQSIAAVKIVRNFKYFFPTSYPSSYPSMEYSTQNTVLTYNKHVYNISGNSEHDLPSSFTVLNTQNADDYQMIAVYVYNALVYAGYPTSYPVSYPL